MPEIDFALACLLVVSAAAATATATAAAPAPDEMQPPLTPKPAETLRNQVIALTLAFYALPIEATSNRQTKRS